MGRRDRKSTSWYTLLSLIPHFSISFHSCQLVEHTPNVDFKVFWLLLFLLNILIISDCCTLGHVPDVNDCNTGSTCQFRGGEFTNEAVQTNAPLSPKLEQYLPGWWYRQIDPYLGEVRLSLEVDFGLSEGLTLLEDNFPMKKRSTRAKQGSKREVRWKENAATYPGKVRIPLNDQSPVVKSRTLSKAMFAILVMARNNHSTKAWKNWGLK